MVNILTYVFLGMIVLANEVYCRWKRREQNRRELLLNKDDPDNFCHSQRKSSSNSSPSIKARVAFATVNLFLFNYANIAGLVWSLAACAKIEDKYVWSFERKTYT